jgi:enolase
MDEITSVVARRVWDSRARPTVEVEVAVGRHRGRAIAPAGASTGSGERRDLRDGGRRLGGLDVGAAVAAVNDVIAPALVGWPVHDQSGIDAALVGLDATADRSRLGANALVATSMAAAWAAAAVGEQPLWRHLGGSGRLPLPEVQIFGGGAHAARRLDLQDLMVVAPAAGSVAEALDWTAEVYLAAGALMAERGQRLGVADEGGWWPAFASNEHAIATLVAAIERAGLTPGDQMALSLDVAASELHHDGCYRLALDERVLARDEMIELLLTWLQRYPIVAVEDPLHEADMEGTAAFTQAVGPGVLVVADDLTVTDADRVTVAADAGAANTLLVKPNQVGTLTEALAAREAAANAGWRAIVSARSGETEDVTVSHLAVGWSADLLKVGSIVRGERTAKWNELLRIELELGPGAVFAGRTPWTAV